MYIIPNYFNKYNKIFLQQSDFGKVVRVRTVLFRRKHLTGIEQH